MPPPRRRPKKGDSASPVQQMVAQGRVALLLRPQIAANLSATELQTAQDALDEVMAIVPQGVVAMRARSHDAHDEEAASRNERLINVEGLFLDRYAVSNRDYLEFVEDGGYEQMSLWDESIWPAVLGFVDRSSQPGPRFWENGKFPRGQDDHPVVGVSWYEAAAFARWAGKRLPTDPEWVKAGTWPVFADGAKPVQRRYPWGESMDRRRANIWGSGHNGTSRSNHGRRRERQRHCAAGGQRLGMDQQLVRRLGAGRPQDRDHEPLKSIRGGAFDTYFDTQAHCQFQSGEGPLERDTTSASAVPLGFCDVVHMSQAREPASVEEAATPEAEEVLA